MLKTIDSLLRKISPAFHSKAKKYFRFFKKKTNPQLTKQEFIALLTEKLNLKKGDVAFVHSSMRNLYLDFDKSLILEILKEVVGSEGTLLFPCWQFNIRAEDFIKQNEIVFDIKNTPSAMGKLPDILRSQQGAYRSFHPTNSIVAIGKHAKELTTDHEKGLFPCGEQSPLYKMMKYNAKIIGMGVTVDNLTFVHVVEDTMMNDFPIKTRNDEVFDCRCINAEGNEEIIKTLVASKEIGHRDVFGFFKKFIPHPIYRSLNVKNIDFFSLDSVEGFKALKDLASSGKTIYNFS
jgi:aminoglycoside 3-N-acetyltransferase